MAQDLKSFTYTERINLVQDSGEIQPQNIDHKITVDQKAPKLGVMLVGWGGNNGSTLTAGVLANRKGITWKTKTGEKSPNFFGSLTQSVTTKVGLRYNKEANTIEDVHKVIKDIVPLVDPAQLEITGWDISGANIYEACYRAQVLEPTLIDQLEEDMSQMVPLKAVLNPDYVAANQEDRVTNVMTGTNQECVEKLREDIRTFSQTVDKVVILWTANTEKMFNKEVKTGDQLMQMVRENEPLPSSVLYGVAAALEGVIYLNGSPQNTVSQGLIDLCTQNKGYIGGADFKTGQTKFKGIMADFFIGSGLRLASCMSYNHLGNNDGKNLSDADTFKSKEISKAGVLQDSVNSNPVLYPRGRKNIDHTIVIKYCPFVGDSKRAMDEYTAEIFMNGLFTLVTHATCEDSLLAVPIMIDLIVLAEFFTRVTIDEKQLGPVLSYLSFFFKAPVTNHPEYVINAFGRQKETLVNLLKACAGIPADDATMLHVGY